MATLGPNDLKQFALPGTWDAAYLTKYALAEGITYDQVLSDIASAIAMANGALLNDPLVASLVSVTEEATLEYQVGNSNEFEEHTEYSQPDAKRAATAGTMLPLRAWDYKLGWTWDFLRKARQMQIDGNVASAIAAAGNLWQKRVLTKLFKSDYDAVGSTGKSVPLADGGTADSTYIPINKPDRASAFAYTHDHIGAQNGITQAILEIGIANLWEHGHDAPFDLLIAQADIASWSNTTNVTGYIKKADGLIRYGNSTDLANVSNDYIAVVETSAYGPVRVRASARIPTTYWAVYKSYGNLDARNPLVVRASPQYGVGSVLLSGRQYPITTFPLEGAILFTEYGVGVADRVGAAVYINSAGAYSTPTIS